MVISTYGESYVINNSAIDGFMCICNGSNHLSSSCAIRQKTKRIIVLDERWRCIVRRETEYWWDNTGALIETRSPWFVLPVPRAVHITRFAYDSLWSPSVPTTGHLYAPRMTLWHTDTQRMLLWNNELIHGVSKITVNFFKIFNAEWYLSEHSL
jgi:hypothetical protein